LKPKVEPKKVTKKESKQATSVVHKEAPVAMEEDEIVVEDPPVEAPRKRTTRKAE
jgi:hypothetical protein